MDPGDVTLAIPCYNVAETLPRVLAAVDRLDPAPAAVLCVDDGSTDGTKAIIGSHDVACIEHAENRGLGATQNTALAHTTTPGFAKIDGDVLVEPEWVEKLCQAVDEKNAALAYGRFRERASSAADRWRERHTSSNFPDEPRLNAPINGSNVLCRAAALRDVGGWDERFVRAFDDIDLFERLIRAGHRVYYTPQVVTTHIRTDTWREALHTAWAYHSNSRSPDRGRLPPTEFRDILRRLPRLAKRSMKGAITDVRWRDFDLLWITLLWPLYHLRWDIESVLTAESEREDCTDHDRINAGGVTVNFGATGIGEWEKRQLCRGWFATGRITSIERHLDVDADVVELGGGIGYVACLVDKRLSASSTHVVVEPNDDLVSLIEHHRELNDGAYEVLNAAYSPEDDRLTSSARQQTAAEHDSAEGGDSTNGGPDRVDLKSLLDRFDLDDPAVIIDDGSTGASLVREELDELVDHCGLLIVEYSSDSLDDEPAEYREAVERRLDASAFDLVERGGTVAAYRAPDEIGS